MKSVIFIDDGIAAKNSRLLATEVASMVVNDLTLAGFAINWAKSNFSPTQKGTWLGTVIDTRTMTFSVPRDKIERLTTSIYSVLATNFVIPLHLAKIAGTLASMHNAIGPVPVGTDTVGLSCIVSKNYYVVANSNRCRSMRALHTENS